jgi:hypothetical protein
MAPHITSIAAGSFGIAPQAKLVIVRAFDAQGVASQYARRQARER